MSGRSRISAQLTFPGFGALTSSPASAAGISPSASPAGRTTGKSGPAPVPASHSPQPASGGASPTTGISGLSGSASSRHAALLSSWASRWPLPTGSDGSTLYSLTWKVRVTPAGRLICALRASARRTSGSGSGGGRTGWPNPAAQEFGPTDVERTRERRRECRAKGYNGNGFGLSLGMAAVLHCSGWPTPTTTDNGAGEDPGAKEARGMKPGLNPADAARLAGWPTPMAGSAARNGNNEAGNTDSSRRTTALCGAEIAGHGLALPPGWEGPARFTASGQMLTGSAAGMDAGGRLDPAHSRWLMGYGPEWDACAPTETRSSRRSPRRSSS